MEGVTSQFIYQPNTLLAILLLIALMASIVKPQLLTALATGVLLIRPNERMDLGISFVQVIILALLLVFIINLNKLKSHLNDKVNKYLFLFIALIIVQTLIFHPSDITDNIMWLIDGLLLYFAIISFIDDDKGIKWLCYAIIISCAIVCFEPLYYHFTEPQGSALWNLFHIEKSGRLQAWGMWANANETAFIACLGIANTLLIAFRFKKKIYYLASVLLIPFFALVIFLTASRAGFASLLLIFLPFIILIRQKSIKFMSILLILCAIAGSQTFTPERTDAEGSTEAREELRASGIQLFKEFPIFGVGFRRAIYEVGSKALHNTYVQAFAETGILGGLLLVAYLFNTGKRLYILCMVNKSNIPDTSLFVVFGLYCSSIFYFFWGNQLLSTIFFLILAQITNTIIIAEKQQTIHA